MLRRIQIAFLCATLAGCAAQHARGTKPSLLFLTDFGTRDGAVAACKGVMWSVAPRLRVTDLSHDIPPFDNQTAGEVIEQAVPFYPPGTVVVAVVDPGVGSARKPMAARTRAFVSSRSYARSGCSGSAGTSVGGSDDSFR